MKTGVMKVSQGLTERLATLELGSVELSAKVFSVGLEEGTSEIDSIEAEAESALDGKTEIADIGLEEGGSVISEVGALGEAVSIGVGTIGATVVDPCGAMLGDVPFRKRLLSWIVSLEVPRTILMGMENQSNRPLTTLLSFS